MYAHVWLWLQIVGWEGEVGSVDWRYSYDIYHCVREARQSWLYREFATLKMFKTQGFGFQGVISEYI